METLKKVLTIPENHKIHFDVTLPDNFPTGQVEVLLVFSTQSVAFSKITNIKLLELAGSLKDSSNFGGDPLLIQKALRDEWSR